MKIDARKLHSSAQEEKRRTAIKLWKKKLAVTEIASLLEVSHTAVHKWINAYKAEGISALKSKKRGHSGVGQRLTPDQSEHIKKLITDKLPDQLKLAYVLWTRKAVRELIEQEWLHKHT